MNSNKEEEARISFNLQRTFAILALLAIIVSSTISGFLLFRYLSQNLLEQDMVISNEFVQSAAQINDIEAYFKGSREPIERAEIDNFFRFITQIPDLLRANIFDTNQIIIWSSSKELVGKRFVDNDELVEALQGNAVYAKESASEAEKMEHQFLPGHITDFVESYLPIWNKDHSHVIGVLELYKAPPALFAALVKGKWLVLSISTIAGILLFLFLFWVVRHASLIINNQASELNNRIKQLSDLLQQNRNLRSRIQSASSRAVELNEQFLRRVGAELHDGPAQSLGFALLRLGAVKGDGQSLKKVDKEFELVKQSLKDALREMRSISAGLVVPELTKLSLVESLTKVVRDHEQRNKTKVDVSFSDLPDDCTLPVKICAYRFAQEGLNNAYRHAGDVAVTFFAYVNNDELNLKIEDAGSGFEVDYLNTSTNLGLGLLGMRERIESLGGEFFVESKLGHGTTIFAVMKLNP